MKDAAVQGRKDAVNSVRNTPKGHDDSTISQSVPNWGHAAPIDIVLSQRQMTQPDVVFISKERLGIIERVIMGPVDLAVEVISPGGRTRDRIEKRDLHEQYGVKEYWIVDPEAQTVEGFFLTEGEYKLVGAGVPARRLPRACSLDSELRWSDCSAGILQADGVA